MLYGTPLPLQALIMAAIALAMVGLALGVMAVAELTARLAER